jgi:DUF2924 family protein
MESASMKRSQSRKGADGLGIADDVAAKLWALEQMDGPALRREWRRLYRCHPPKGVRRDLLLLGVAWKAQEQAYGGLGPATKRRLADLAETLERDGDVTRGRVARLRTGVKLVREWRGEIHTVIVGEDGFEWRGRHWRSLVGDRLRDHRRSLVRPTLLRADGTGEPRQQR